MTLKQLYYFQKLAELQNYTQAARELFISQPSLSYTIKELEKEFPAPLFEKQGTGNKICLSSSGRIFLHYVQEALKNIEEGKNAVQQHVISEKNVLRIGYIHTFPFSALSQLFREFQSQTDHPPLLLRQEISSSDSDLVEQLRLQKLDFAFCLLPTGGICSFPAFKQDLFVIVSKKHPLGNRTSISFQEIQSEPWVRVGHAHATNQVLEELFHLHHCTPLAPYEASNISVAVTYTLGERCYAIAPKLPTMDFSQVTALTIDGFPLARPIYFAWKANKSFTENEQLFYDFIRKKFPQAPTECL